MSRKIQNIIGIISVVLLALLAAVVFLKKETPVREAEVAAGVIKFEKDELVFDGSGKLDLMKGVIATNSDGSDASEQVEVIITADSTLSRKVVRYTFVDVAGHIVSAKRSLVMKNYSGPSLNVKDNLTLNGDDLRDIINILRDNGMLKAEDGYGRDITADVKCIREKKDNGLYTMTFSVVNAYADSEAISVTAHIDGDVSDPEITLSETEIQLQKMSDFYALDYVTFSTDGASDNVSDKIEIDSSVNTSESGDYRVVYRLYSADKTAVITKVLKVKVI